jgi:hypothetical protein
VDLEAELLGQRRHPAVLRQGVGPQLRHEPEDCDFAARMQRAE